MTKKISTFGVYVHMKPSGEVFYVGKGGEARATLLQRNNRGHSAIVKRYGAENILVRWFACRSEAHALRREVELIALLRSAGVRLVNATEGGEGASGLVVKVETRRKVSETMRRKWEDSEYRQKATKRNDGQLARQASAAKKQWESKEFRGKVARGVRSYLESETFHLKRSEVQRRIAKKRWENPGERERAAARALGRKILHNPATGEERRVRDPEYSALLGMGWLPGMPPGKGNRSKLSN